MNGQHLIELGDSCSGQFYFEDHEMQSSGAFLDFIVYTCTFFVDTKIVSLQLSSSFVSVLYSLCCISFWCVALVLLEVTLAT